MKYVIISLFLKQSLFTHLNVAYYNEIHVCLWKIIKNFWLIEVNVSSRTVFSYTTIKCYLKMLKYCHLTMPDILAIMTMVISYRLNDCESLICWNTEHQQHAYYILHAIIIPLSYLHLCRRTVPIAALCRR